MVQLWFLFPLDPVLNVTFKVRNNEFYCEFPCISAIMPLKKVITINSLISAKNYNMNFLCKNNKSTQTAASLLFIITKL